jgi:hypothetical protein
MGGELASCDSSLSGTARHPLGRGVWCARSSSAPRGTMPSVGPRDGQPLPGALVRNVDATRTIRLRQVGTDEAPRGSAPATEGDSVRSCRRRGRLRSPWNVAAPPQVSASAPGPRTSTSHRPRRHARPDSYPAPSCSTSTELPRARQTHRRRATPPDHHTSKVRRQGLTPDLGDSSWATTIWARAVRGPQVRRLAPATGHHVGQDGVRRLRHKIRRRPAAALSPASASTS